jgi:hypothetical protein
MYRMYPKLHGNDGNEDICWCAPSSVMNSKLPVRVVDSIVAAASLKHNVLEKIRRAS